MNLNEFIPPTFGKEIEEIGISFWVKASSNLQGEKLQGLIDFSTSKNGIFIHIQISASWQYLTYQHTHKIADDIIEVDIEMKVITKNFEIEYSDQQNCQHHEIINLLTKEWQLIVITVQNEESHLITHSSGYFLLKKNLQSNQLRSQIRSNRITFSAYQFLQFKNFRLHYSNQQKDLSNFSQDILNLEFSRHVCSILSSSLNRQKQVFQTQSIFLLFNNRTNTKIQPSCLFVIDVGSINSEFNQQVKFNSYLNESQSVILILRLKQFNISDCQSTCAIDINNLIHLIFLNEDKGITKLSIVVDDKEYFLGRYDQSQSQLIIQIEKQLQNDAISYSYTYLENQSQNRKLQIITERKEKEFAVNKLQFSGHAINNMNLTYEFFIFENYYILERDEVDHQKSNCAIQAKRIDKVSIDQIICISYDLEKQPLNSEIELKQELRIQRKLTSVQFIHGSSMKSIVRNLFENSSYQSTISSVQTQDFLIIGYFQMIQSYGSQWISLITLGKLSEFYNFLHLYITSSNTIQLRYIHNTNNILSTISQTVSNLQGVWIGLGIFFSQVQQQVNIVYTDISTSQIMMSIAITPAVLNASYSSLDVCISCTVPGGRFDKYTGKVSSVKVIYGVNFSELSSYYFFNEQSLSKSSILSNSFSLSSYVESSEYDFGNGSTCQQNYVFFEGICLANTNCSDLSYESDTHATFESGKFYHSPSQKCLSCMNNCVSCSSFTLCTTCRSGYAFIQNECVKYDSSNPNLIQCSGSQTLDTFNQICSTSFDTNIHQLSSPLLSGRFFLASNEVQISPSVSTDKQITLCYINADNNPMTLYSFLGGQYFTQSTKLIKSWTGIPQGYMKKVTLYALFYGSDDYTKLNVKVNNNLATLSYFQIIDQNKISCSQSDSQTQSFYKVEYTIMDYQTILNLEISSIVDKWAIRNLNVIVMKCHPSCKTCYFGGKSSDCSSCQSGMVKNKFQCNCQVGQFAQYINKCYSSPCVTCQSCTSKIENCIKCEDITGNCTQCQEGYKIMNGVCLLETDCKGNDEKFDKFCGIRKQLSFKQYDNNQVVQYVDYWDLGATPMSAFSCMNKQFLPQLGLGNSYILKFTMPSYYQYHYQLWFDIDIGVFDSLDNGQNDRVEIYDGSTRILYREFGNYKNQDPSSKQYCSNGIYPDNYYRLTYNVLKSTNQLEFKFFSFTNESIFNESHSFTQLEFTFERCHPFCQSCTNSLISNCVSCIPNAAIVNGICKCNDGFYFALDRIPLEGNFPGKCLPCDISCQTCSGPSFQDCISCKSGYNLLNNSCNYQCPDGQYWDNNNSICIPCHPCCRTCATSSNNQCFDCFEGFQISSIDQKCTNTLYNSICTDCSIAINSLCGGSLAAHYSCLSNGWIVITSQFCVNCTQYVNGKCGGDLSSEASYACYQEGYYNYNSNSCSSCKDVNGIQCGRNEIKNFCASKNWINFNGKCYNCNSDSLSLSQCLCDITCKTCSNYFNPNVCTSCSSPLVLYNNQCLSHCPNGYIANNQVCVPCTDSQMTTCFNCYSTCSICYPFKVSNIPNNCVTCSSSRQLLNGECVCKDTEDTRQIFFECSYLSVAVIEPILSNQIPQLSINFGKLLSIPSGFTSNQFSSILCELLFTTQTLKLFGKTYECSIYAYQIIIKFNDDSDIIEGDLIYFNENKLSFQSSPSTFISRFYNNIVVQQQIVGQPKVIYNIPTDLNSCNDINFTLNKFDNTGGRGFRQIKWSISSFTPFMETQYNLLNNLLAKYTTEQTIDLFIPKGIIKSNIIVIIRLDYNLKINIKSYEEFTIKVKNERKIVLDIKSPIIFPLYRFQPGFITIELDVVYCDNGGGLSAAEPIDLKIDSQEYSALNYRNSNFLDNEYIIEITPFTLPITTITIHVMASLVQNSFITSQGSFILDVKKSKLKVQIIGGNGYFNYKTNVEIFGKIRDYDVQNETDPQGIDIVWECIDLQTLSTCLDRMGTKVIFPPNKNSVTIQQSTFNPYTVVKIQLSGSKQTYETITDSITVFFSELDLPQLDVELETADPEQKTINLNEEIYVTLGYNSDISVDYLSFSGTIVYEEQIVGIIKYDYYTLRFQIWNYFTKFKRENNSFQIRFNVFNPEYYMPSISIINFSLNFPPNNCLFTVVLSEQIGYSIESIYLLQMQNCEDENEPIQYQFFYYASADDFEFEKKYPLQVKRRQITDKQSSSFIETGLPGGNLLLMAQAIDSKLAIFNTTQAISVQLKQYSEIEYTQLISYKLQQISSLSNTNAILELSIISEDILVRNQFQDSVSFSQKKIELQNTLSSLSKNLRTLSTFATIADKAIVSLTQSGIKYSTSQSTSLLDDLITTLDQSSNLQSFNLDLQKEKLKQKLFDNFLMLDSLVETSGTSQNIIKDQTSQNKFIELQDKIGSYLFKNILPNENPIIFKGKKLKVLSNQVTQKYVCSYFICENSGDGLQINDGNNSAGGESNIRNVKFLTQNENLYTNDFSFKNYTDNLLLLNPQMDILYYPIVTPSIKDEKNQEVIDFQNKVAVQFDALDNNQDQMACLSKVKNQWTQNGCKSFYNKSAKKYTCVCEELSPITVIQDLQDLLNKNNLGVAFGSEGLENILNFDDFYKYAVFWTLLALTIGYVILHFKGKQIDLQQGIPKNNQNYRQIFPITPNNDILNKEDSDKEVNKDIENQKSVQNQEYENVQHLNRDSILSEQKEEEHQNENEFTEQKQQINKTKIQLIQYQIKQIRNTNTQDTIRNPSIVSQEQLFQNQTEINAENKNQEIQEDKQSNIKVLRKKSSNPDQIENKDKVELQNIQEISIIQKKEGNNLDQKVFEKATFQKKLLLFHSFFSIFYINNPELPRSLRFLIFYVRTIHSLGISVVFSLDYSIAQRIGVAMINSITLIVIVKVIEIMFLIQKRCFNYFSKLLILLILGIYYYIIISIVSGQTPKESNLFFITFLLVLLTDFILISTLSAFIQLIIAKKIMQSMISNKFIVLIGKAIELKLIIQSLK